MLATASRHSAVSHSSTKRFIGSNFEKVSINNECDTKNEKNSNKSVTNFRNRMVIEKNGGPTHRRSQRNPQILLDSSGGLVYKAVWTGLKSFDLGSRQSDMKLIF